MEAIIISLNLLLLLMLVIVYVRFNRALSDLVRGGEITSSASPRASVYTKVVTHYTLTSTLSSVGVSYPSSPEFETLASPTPSRSLVTSTEAQASFSLR
ncbi:hypothetical protein NLI96_g9378 [Meripilus lineatus]|uniref:Uncharacterized protein n=1 Tax=Meripilus lineatus TaxID=2056292 RepID=A0AAD5UXV1_9APHY|nr:hypothetical protein NLI96_g9378 [Physisporinus lineatus]